MHGKQNEDASTHCLECGTSFGGAVQEEAFPFFKLQESSAAPSFRNPVSSALGSILICTGAGALALKVVYDAEVVFYNHPGMPGIYAIGFGAAFLVLPILAFLSIFFCFATCIGRSKSVWQGILSFLAAMIVIFSAVLIRPFRSMLPAASLAALFHSPLGWYLGAVIQLLLGAWFLGWFTLRTNSRSGES